MIKINIDEISKEEIEKKLWEDANSNNTGLIRVLNTTDAKNILMNNHKKIYDVLYDTSTGDLNTAEVKKLLLADQKTLKEYIRIFGPPRCFPPWILSTVSNDCIIVFEK